MRGLLRAGLARPVQAFGGEQVSGVRRRVPRLAGIQSPPASGLRVRRRDALSASAARATRDNFYENAADLAAGLLTGCGALGWRFQRVA